MVLCYTKDRRSPCYQELVEILQWVVEIGRVGILLETSLFFSHLVLPRIGHLE